MNLTFTSPADPGLLLALKQVKSPGLAMEFGMGTGRNLRACAKKGFDCTGYDVNDWIIEQSRNQFVKDGISAKVLNQDVLNLKFQPHSLAVAIVGTAIYWPKSIVHVFLEKLWKALKPGGILHMEFATPQDATFKSNFVLYTCVPAEDGYSNSFRHTSMYCGNCSIEHPGVLGASYWNSLEIVGLFNQFGKWQPISRKLNNWKQQSGDGDVLLRSFERVTINKVS